MQHGMEWNGMEWNGMEWHGMQAASMLNYAAGAVTGQQKGEHMHTKECHILCEATALHCTAELAKKLTQASHVLSRLLQLQQCSAVQCS